MRPLQPSTIFLFFALFSIAQLCIGQQEVENHIRKRLEIRNGISPKSVVASGNGLFAAQNMMYRHSVTFYDEDGNSLAKVKDAIELNDFGVPEASGTYKGAPVEGVFTNDGNYLWVSNYHMTGEGFENPGCDDCSGNEFDNSYLYKINTTTFKIEAIVEVGSVPKYLALSANEKWLLVSNWVSSDVSIIDVETEKEIKRLHVGTHPRGITITTDESTAFVTLMGSNKLAQIDLNNFEVIYTEKLGKAPRSVLFANNDSTLYVTLNNENKVVEYNRYSGEKRYCSTLAGPRSMVISPNEKYLYLVNYFDQSFSKISTDSMQVLAEIKTGDKPIGICGNWNKAEIWVACYSGKIEVFRDFELEQELFPKKLLGVNWSEFAFETALIDSSTSNSTIDTTSNTTTVAVHPKQTIPQRPSHKAVKSSENCNYHIIVGAFSVPANATRKADELIEKGYAAQTIKGTELTYVSATCSATEQGAETAKIEVRSTLEGASSAWILRQ